MAEIKGAGDDDMADGMQCSDHPYRSNPGGICAFCLQDKLGKLLSSSFPLPIRPSSSSSTSSPSDNIPPSTSTSTSASAVPPPSSLYPTSSTNTTHSRRPRLPFLLVKKKKKKPSPSAAPSDAAILKRSKSTATPRRPRSLLDPDDLLIHDFTPRKRNHGFWSFLYHSSKSSKSFRDTTATPTISETSKPKSLVARRTDIVVVEEDNTPNSSHSTASFERKVSRSRSVGCGSRSFSGDFFERISTGFGDCTLRRVESHREGKHKQGSSSSSAGGGGGASMNNHHHHCMKERVRCGGLFSGFMMTSSSSSSSSSSYWVSSSADDNNNNNNGNNKASSSTSTSTASVATSLSHSHGRVRSWGWAFASPMRAFSAKPSSSKDNHNRRDIIRDANHNDNHNNNKNAATPNLSAIPSLLTVRS